MYTKKVMDHFMNPRNMGEIPDADGVGRVGNPVCGDMMTVYIKVRDDRLEDVKFKTFGCGAAIATSSMVTELAKGKTIEEAISITKADVAEELGGLPPVKMHCSVLAVDGLSEAIYEYLSKNGLPIPDALVKRHQRLKIELERIEKKYKEFLEMEKELLKG
ncbi:MAG: Fe-S cluster assembly scaffold protein NifU [Candidatus Bathyarchaeia archaeon]